MSLVFVVLVGACDSGRKQTPSSIATDTRGDRALGRIGARTDGGSPDAGSPSVIDPGALGAWARDAGYGGVRNIRSLRITTSIGRRGVPSLELANVGRQAVSLMDYAGVERLGRDGWRLVEDAGLLLSPDRCAPNATGVTLCFTLGPGETRTRPWHWNTGESLCVVERGSHVGRGTFRFVVYGCGQARWGESAPFPRMSAEGVPLP